MSLSRKSEKLPELTKDKFYQGRHFKKIISETIKKIWNTWSVYQIILLIMVIISGIGELIKAKFSLGWYLLCLINLVYLIIKDLLIKNK